MNTITLSSPAKINLFLEVKARLQDGYHQIDTIFQEIDFHDYLTLSIQKEGISVLTDSDKLSSQEQNLVFLAAKLLQEQFHVAKGVHIQLQKRIPIAAGLGGGSSNAACALIGLNRLWELNLSDEELCKCGQRLGADVPFFLKGGTMLSGGKGDEMIRRITVPKKFWIVLVNPGFSIATRDVYRALKFPLTKYNSNISLLLNSLEEGIIVPEIMYNRLEEVVLSKYPSLQKLKQELINAGALVSLVSGSGPTVFALAHTENDAKKIHNYILRKYNKAVFSVICTTTNR